MFVEFPFLAEDVPALEFQRINRRGDIFFKDSKTGRDYVATKDFNNKLYYLNNVMISEGDYDHIIGNIGNECARTKNVQSITQRA